MGVVSLIDNRGRALYAIVTFLIEIEEERFSDPLSEAMGTFDKYMNKINHTEGYLYDKDGNILMEA